MNKCVECKVTLVSPRQVPLCDKCHQEMFDYAIDRLGEEEKEVVEA
ncbi:hypothetical protein [Evansella clarkii]|nr:hypothetical protein [Evansella clarkii]